MELRKNEQFGTSDGASDREGLRFGPRTNGRIPSNRGWRVKGNRATNARHLPETKITQKQDSSLFSRRFGSRCSPPRSHLPLRLQQKLADEREDK